MSFTGVDGKTYRISDSKGKKVYLKFGLHGVPSVFSQLPRYRDELAKEESDDYVVLTVVSPGQKGEQAEEAFKNGIKDWTISFTSIARPLGQLLASYGVRSYPTQAFIDKEGKLVKTQPGFMDKETILENLKTMN